MPPNKNIHSWHQLTLSCAIKYYFDACMIDWISWACMKQNIALFLHNLLIDKESLKSPYYYFCIIWRFFKFVFLCVLFKVGTTTISRKGKKKFNTILISSNNNIIFKLISSNNNIIFKLSPSNNNKYSNRFPLTII